MYYFNTDTTLDNFTSETCKQVKDTIGNTCKAFVC